MPKKEWHHKWDKGYTVRQLYEIQKEEGVGRKTKRTTKEENVTRLRFGHIKLNKTNKPTKNTHQDYVRTVDLKSQKNM